MSLMRFYENVGLRAFNQIQKAVFVRSRCSLLRHSLYVMFNLVAMFEIIGCSATRSTRPAPLPTVAVSNHAGGRTTNTLNFSYGLQGPIWCRDLTSRDYSRVPEPIQQCFSSVANCQTPEPPWLVSPVLCNQRTSVVCYKQGAPDPAHCYTTIVHCTSNWRVSTPSTEVRPGRCQAVTIR